VTILPVASHAAGVASDGDGTAVGLGDGDADRGATDWAVEADGAGGVDVVLGGELTAEEQPATSRHAKAVIAVGKWDRRIE
jgi:hypothetical protein